MRITDGVYSLSQEKGGHVHVHNVKFIEQASFTGAGAGTMAASSGPNSLPPVFMGYRRKDGRAGPRNYVAVVASVNCSATVVNAGGAWARQ